MNKRITSLLLSVVLVLLAVFVLHNEKVVEAADNMVLLEKRHPGYWNWLRTDAVNEDTDGDGRTDVIVYPVSKAFLKDITSADYQFFLKDASRDDNRKLIYFLDGTGIDVDDSIYGEVNNQSWTVNKKIGSVITNAKYISLNNSTGTNPTGINGIRADDKPFNEITDIYQYLVKVNNPDITTIISAMDDAETGWNDKLNQLLKDLHLDAGFRFRDSYIAVIDQGQVLFEDSDQSQICYDGSLFGKELYVKSAGANAGYQSNISYDGIEYSSGGRGLNFLVFYNGKVIDTVRFDTFSETLDCYRDQQISY